MTDKLIKLQSVRADMNAHEDVIESVKETGGQLINRIKDLREQEQLKERLNHVDIRWRHLIALADVIRLVSFFFL